MTISVVEDTGNGLETKVLYSGPDRTGKVVLPVGEFRLYAEIHEEAEAFTVFDIKSAFSTILPTQDEYESMDVKKVMDSYSITGDQARVSQMLLADVTKDKFFKRSFRQFKFVFRPRLEEKRAGSTLNANWSLRSMEISKSIMKT